MPLSAETVAMVEELVGRAHLAVLNTLNGAAEKIYAESEKQVPKSEAHKEDRRGSYPRQDLSERGTIARATIENPVAQVIYDSPYAKSQEVGHMTYETKTGTRVDWRARRYTTPGTKARYLEDPGKMILAMVPEELAIQGRIAVGDLPGLITPQGELQAMGRLAQQQPLPTGAVSETMTEEQVKATQVSYLQVPPAGKSLFAEE